MLKTTEGNMNCRGMSGISESVRACHFGEIEHGHIHVLGDDDGGDDNELKTTVPRSAHLALRLQRQAPPARGPA